MEVPTDVVVVAQLVEQTVDIPVLGARCVPGYGGPQGFLHGQRSSFSAGQIADIPVPCCECHDFHPHPFFLQICLESRFKRFLHSFPQAQKKVPLESELSAHQMPARDDLWVQISTDDDRTFYWNRQQRTFHWVMPPGIRPVWMRTWERARVDHGHALICTGATARPGRDRNSCRRGASIQEQIAGVEVGYAPMIMQLKFQQSFSSMFLDVLQTMFMIRVPDNPVVCRSLVVGVPVYCSDSSRS